MTRKSKGTNAEREIVRMFWQNGWACFRSAGSGSMRFPGPDIIAGNKVRKIAIECKTTKGTSIYLDDHDVSQIKEFSDSFGAEPWVGVRFDKVGWFFLNLEDIEKTGKGYKLDLFGAKRKGLSFEELIQQ
ncbi:MAG TPA: Holliday junction resolvase Hjc [Candidatus Nanoarchaeia archaeon]|nr:Holliday junction resolvase Hjc [Candidatus Nanoarchaeia archaeon]